MVVAVRDSHYNMLCRLYKRTWCHVHTKVKVRGEGQGTVRMDDTAYDVRKFSIQFNEDLK